MEFFHHYRDGIEKVAEISKPKIMVYEYFLKSNEREWIDWKELS